MLKTFGTLCLRTIPDNTIGKKEANPYEELYRFAREHAALNKVDTERMVKEIVFPIRGIEPKI